MAAAAINLKLGHAISDKDVFHASAVKFKEVVEALAYGEITVTIYPEAQLGDDRKLLESLKMDALNMAVVTGAPVANFVPSFGIFDLPFLFESPEHAYRVLDGKIGDDFKKEMAKQGWMALAYGERGFRNITNNIRPIKTPKDLEGLRFRVMPNQVYIDSFKALGVNAVAIPWPETPEALRSGKVDGQENPLNIIASYAIDEWNKYISLTRHAYTPSVILMSMRTWNRLTPMQQTAVQKAANEAARYNREINNKMEAEWLQMLKDKGMHITEPDIPSFKDAVRSVYKKYETRYGKALIDSIVNTK